MVSQLRILPLGADTYDIVVIATSEMSLAVVALRTCLVRSRGAPFLDGIRHCRDSGGEAERGENGGRLHDWAGNVG